MTSTKGKRMNHHVHPVEPWLWGVVAPLPVLALAIFLGEVVSSATRAAQPGIAVGLAWILAVGAHAKHRQTVCAVAFGVGMTLVTAGVFGFVVYALAHMEMG